MLSRGNVHRVIIFCIFYICFSARVAASKVIDDVAVIRAIVGDIYNQQHPTRAECSKKRLLVTQFSPRQFEGIGSNLRNLMFGLAEAMHSNRTLVWGLDLPSMFESSRNFWQGPDHMSINNIEMDCRSWQLYGGGPYTCFFEPISSCSLHDAEYEEIKRLGKNGFSDDERIKVMDSRRGISVYMAPVNSPFFQSISKDKEIHNVNHKWAAALQDYVFRLKPDLRSVFGNNSSLTLYNFRKFDSVV